MYNNKKLFPGASITLHWPHSTNSTVKDLQQCIDMTSRNHWHGDKLLKSLTWMTLLLYPLIRATYEERSKKCPCYVNIESWTMYTSMTSFAKKAFNTDFLFIIVRLADIPNRQSSTSTEPFVCSRLVLKRNQELMCMWCAPTWTVSKRDIMDCIW